MLKFKNSKYEHYLHALFKLGIFIKGFNGFWETISGLFVLLFSKATFNNMFFFVFRDELLDEPHDSFIDFLALALQNLSAGTKTFAAVYILLHGIMNIFLAVQLYRNKLWAYLVTINVMIVLVFYQIYRIVLYHSIMLKVLTVFDIFFIILAWHEYRYQTEVLIARRLK